MTQSQPVAESKEEAEERLECQATSNVQKGSVPSDTSEHEEAPKQKKAAASPN